MTFLGLRLAGALLVRFVWFYWKTRHLSGTPLRRCMQQEAAAMRSVLERFGIRVHFTGEPIAPPALIASQHQSWLETVLFYLTLEEPVFIAKKELRAVPLLGDMLRRAGCVFVDRDNPDILPLFAQVRKRLRENTSVIIFPEATRRNVADIRPGVAAFYEDVKVPVQVVTLQMRDCFPDGGILNAHPGKCLVHFGEVFASGEVGGKALLRHLRRAFGLQQGKKGGKHHD